MAKRGARDAPDRRVVHQVLRRVLVRIGTRPRWTQCVFARDRFGSAVHPRDPRAVRWCVSGAVAREVPNVPPIMFGLQTRVEDELCRAAKAAGFSRSMISINDSLDGYPAVLAILKRAIRATAAR